jgi:GNAT superfamily N-acetyltransferase
MAPRSRGCGWAPLPTTLTWIQSISRCPAPRAWPRAGKTSSATTVDALLIDRDQWRHGAGTVLLEAAEAWGRDRGAQVARLDTYAHSPVSVPFYEDRMGYQRRSIIFQKQL